MSLQAGVIMQCSNTAIKFHSEIDNDNCFVENSLHFSEKPINACTENKQNDKNGPF